MSKGKIFLFTILGIVLVGLVTALILLNIGTEESKPTSTVELSVNPGVELVLDADNKVMSVKYNNTDAEIIFSNEEIIGEDIDEVAKLFVKNATEAGYVDVNTTGTTVEITVNGKSAKSVEDLENTVISTINEYFSENGIIAGAVASIKEDVQAQADALNVSVEKYRLMLKAQAEDASIKLEDLAKKNEQQLMEQINANVQELKGVAVEKRADLENQYQDLYDACLAQKETILSFLNTIPGLSEDFAQNSIKEIKAFINDIENELIKETMLEAFEAIEQDLVELDKTLEQNYSALKETIRTQSESLYETYKAEFQNRINDAQTAIEEHRINFEANKESIQQQIEAYQQSLVNNNA